MMKCFIISCWTDLCHLGKINCRDIEMKSNRLDMQKQQSEVLDWFKREEKKSLENVCFFVSVITYCANLMPLPPHINPSGERSCLRPVWALSISRLRLTFHIPTPRNVKAETHLQVCDSSMRNLKKKKQNHLSMSCIDMNPNNFLLKNKKIVGIPVYAGHKKLFFTCLLSNWSSYCKVWWLASSVFQLADTRLTCIKTPACPRLF